MSEFKILWCMYNQIENLKLNCPSLNVMSFKCNNIKNINFDCPFLTHLTCAFNPLTNLHGLEFCSNLNSITISPDQEHFLTTIKVHFPEIEIEINDKKIKSINSP
jgi:hypothetical protein